MTIKELKSGQGNVNVQGVITEVGEIRIFNKFGRELKVANAVLKDDTGTIKLTLWNDEAIKYKEGDEIKIENGYVNEFQGEPQLTAGKFGKIVLVEKGSGSEKAQSKLSDIEDESDTEEEPTEEAGEEEVSEEETPVKEAEEEPEEEASEKGTKEPEEEAEEEETPVEKSEEPEEEEDSEEF
jgi:replication factor A1